MCRFGLSGIYKARTKLIRRQSSMTVPNECAKYAIWLCDVGKYRCRTLEYLARLYRSYLHRVAKYDVEMSDLAVRCKNIFVSLQSKLYLIC